MEVAKKTNYLSEVGVSYETQHAFNPYTFNGGTVLAVSGPDFAIAASDTRLSEGFMIHSRNCPKIYPLTDKTVLLSTGFHGDVLTLTKIVQARLLMYQHEHNVPMSTSAIAAMLSTMLYYRRFFPYYVYNIVVGLDDEGTGCLYSYDPVGSYERNEYHAAGSAAAILQPLLDNQVGYKNQEGVAQLPLTQDKALTLVKDVFISAAERDIQTGDGLRLCIITRDGIKYQDMPLRKD
jgi:20S proteasome subunit beta 6